MKWCAILAACLVVGASAVVPYDQGRRMSISNTTQCEDLGGSCSLPADCDLSANIFHGSCDNTTFGCCIPTHDLCAAMKGECLSEVECSTKSAYNPTRLSCSGGICCVPQKSSLRHGGDGTGQGNGRKKGGSMGGNRPGRRMISNTTQCEAVNGTCSLPAVCDLSTNVFHGSCDNTGFGCCIPRDDLCAAMKGVCLSKDQCSAKSGYRPTRLSCSSGVCCVPEKSFPRNGGDGTGQGSGRKKGGSMGSNRPGRRMISNTTQCEAVNGSCSLPADCDLSTNVFHGSCDNTGFGCCIPRDDLCATKKGECLSKDECSAKSGYHPTRLLCTSGICCVPKRSSPRNGGKGKGTGKGNQSGEHMGHGHRGRRPEMGRRESRPSMGRRGDRRGKDKLSNEKDDKKRTGSGGQGGRRGGGRSGHGGRDGRS